MFYYVLDLVDETAKMQTRTHNETAHMLPLYNRATTCYNYILQAIPNLFDYIDESRIAILI